MEHAGMDLGKRSDEQVITDSSSTSLGLASREPDTAKRVHEDLSQTGPRKRFRVS
jgi:hypothetical protein